jgi:hypothetical protein
MDECPRCQSQLERLSLDDVTTLACKRCGFANVPVDHESERDDLESWREALDRFYEE